MNALVKFLGIFAPVAMFAGMVLLLVAAVLSLIFAVFDGDGRQPQGIETRVSKTNDNVQIVRGRWNSVEISMVTLEDGSRCAVLISSKGPGQGDLECDWQSK